MSKRSMERYTFLLAIMLPIVATAISPMVNTTLGRLRGTTITTREGRVVPAFLGIPFAKPPIGTLRFEPPQPVDPWKIEKPAITHARPCAQVPLLNPGGSEDCLYLDVYSANEDLIERCTPVLEVEKLAGLEAQPLLPVVVYFYGGGNEVGAANAYIPVYLMDEDIVYVIIQYRLGLFGFLSTGDEVVPGNMALKDLRAGLRWVRANIVNFGGDPTKVTIFGESAGASFVHYFMLFAADEGLFRAGISHSGSALATWTFTPPVEVEKGKALLSNLSSCPTDSVGLVDCLRTKTAAQLVILYDVFYKNFMDPELEIALMGLLPLLGAVLEPECVQDRFVDGNPWDRKSTLPWLLGVNSKESIFVFTLELYDKTGIGFNLVNSKFDSLLPQALKYQNSHADGSNVPRLFRDFYLKNKPISRATLAPLVDGTSDALFIYPSYEAALKSNNNQTFFFLYDYIGVNELIPIPPDARIGACHTDELFMFFPHPSLSVPVPPIPSIKDTMLSKKLVRIWVNFVTHLTPASPGPTEDFEWTPFHPLKSYLHIKQDGQVIENQFLSERMEFWENVPYPNRDDILSVPECKRQNQTSYQTANLQNKPNGILQTVEKIIDSMKIRKTKSF